MLGDRSTIRKLAGDLLVVWLLALGAGFAHACPLAPPVATSEQAEFGLHGHAPSGDVGEAICLKFSDEAKAIAKSLQPGGDPFATALPVSMATPRVGDEPLAATSTGTRARWQTDRPRLPISIAYLRLAL